MFNLLSNTKDTVSMSSYEICTEIALLIAYNIMHHLLSLPALQERSAILHVAGLELLGG